jgi:hypothetical protein
MAQVFRCRRAILRATSSPFGTSIPIDQQPKNWMVIGKQDSGFIRCGRLLKREMATVSIVTQPSEDCNFISPPETYSCN